MIVLGDEPHAAHGGDEHEHRIEVRRPQVRTWVGEARGGAPLEIDALLEELPDDLPEGARMRIRRALEEGLGDIEIDVDVVERRDVPRVVRRRVMRGGDRPQGGLWVTDMIEGHPLPMEGGSFVFLTEDLDDDCCGECEESCDEDWDDECGDCEDSCEEDDDCCGECDESCEDDRDCGRLHYGECEDPCFDEDECCGDCEGDRHHDGHGHHEGHHDEGGCPFLEDHGEDVFHELEELVASLVDERLEEHFHGMEEPRRRGRARDERHRERMDPRDEMIEELHRELEHLHRELDMLHRELDEANARAEQAERGRRGDDQRESKRAKQREKRAKKGQKKEAQKKAPKRR